MIAALGMYDMPALQPANDRFWKLIRHHLGHGPETLDRGADMWRVWQHPSLVFAQTCGMPYRHRLHEQVQLIGTPDYGLPECPPGFYRSVFVAHGDDTRDLTAVATGRFAFNEPLSQSGWSAPMVHLAEWGILPTEVLQTGAHAKSAEAVAQGRADYAALDALTWEMLKRHTDLGVSLREIGATKPTPGLPYIASKSADAPATAQAVQAAIRDLSERDKDLLHLQGLRNIPKDSYLRVIDPPPSAHALLSS